MTSLYSVILEQMNRFLTIFLKKSPIWRSGDIWRPPGRQIGDFFKKKIFILKLPKSTRNSIKKISPSNEKMSRLCYKWLTVLAKHTIRKKNAI